MTETVAANRGAEVSVPFCTIVILFSICRASVSLILKSITIADQDTILLNNEGEIVMNETSGEPQLGEPLLGWVAQKAAEDEWWGEGGKTAPFGTRYVTSMYGIFNGLENGFTDNEKYFAIFSELIVSSLICKLQQLLSGFSLKR